jgi:23S rRNA-/tRNA-specific pseudouridylate synthase
MSGHVRWVVREGDGERLADVLAKVGEGAAGAADEGRAFVNGKRAAAEDAVAVGDAVEIWSAREAVAGEAEVSVIARWGEIVAAYKPAALATTPDRRGAASLVVEVGKILRRAMPHAASRLDVGVSGVVLCALGSQGLAHIEEMRSQGRLKRTYVALAAGVIEGEGTWSAPIGRERGSSGRL